MPRHARCVGDDAHLGCSLFSHDLPPRLLHGRRLFRKHTSHPLACHLFIAHCSELYTYCWAPLTVPRPCSCDAQASVPRVVEAWEASAPPISAWTSRLFFASIGFAVPATELFSAEALGYGALLTAIAICSKVVTGVFEWDSKFSIGWAMVGRGELGLVMAEEAYRTGLTDELTFAATVGRPPSRCCQTS